MSSELDDSKRREHPDIEFERLRRQPGSRKLFKKAKAGRPLRDAEALRAASRRRGAERSTASKRDIDRQVSDAERLASPVTIKRVGE